MFVNDVNTHWKTIASPSKMIGFDRKKSSDIHHTSLIWLLPCHNWLKVETESSVFLITIYQFVQRLSLMSYSKMQLMHLLTQLYTLCVIFYTSKHLRQMKTYTWEVSRIKNRIIAYTILIYLSQRNLVSYRLASALNPALKSWLLYSTIHIFPGASQV